MEYLHTRLYEIQGLIDIINAYLKKYEVSYYSGKKCNDEEIMNLIKDNINDGLNGSNGSNDSYDMAHELINKYGMKKHSLILNYVVLTFCGTIRDNISKRSGYNFLKKYRLTNKSIPKLIFDYVDNFKNMRIDDISDEITDALSSMSSNYMFNNRYFANNMSREAAIISATKFGNINIVKKLFDKYPHNLDCQYILKNYIDYLRRHHLIGICFNWNIIKYLIEKIRIYEKEYSNLRMIFEYQAIIKLLIQKEDITIFYYLDEVGLLPSIDFLYASLEFAIDMENLDVIMFFLNKNVKPKSHNVEIAAEMNNFKMVQILFKTYNKHQKEAHDNIFISDKMVENGNTEMVNYLVDNGAILIPKNMQKFKSSHLKRLIIIAATNNKFKMVKYLVDIYEKENEKQDLKISYNMIKHKNITMINYLLHKNLKCSYENILMETINRNDHETIKFILNNRTLKCRITKEHIQRATFLAQDKISDLLRITKSHRSSS